MRCNQSKIHIKKCICDYDVTGQKGTIYIKLPIKTSYADRKFLNIKITWLSKYERIENIGGFVK